MRPACYCLGILICLSSVQASERTASEWVEAMHRAQTERSFTGILSYWNGIDLTSIEYNQSIVDGKAQVKAKPLNGPQREITRTDQALSLSLAPDDELHEVSNKFSGNSLSRLLPPDATKLGESYKISMLPDDRIADRSAVGVSIMPKLKDRHGFKIWIDKASALLLRMEMCDCDTHELMNVLQFTEITILEGSPENTEVGSTAENSDVLLNIVDEDQAESGGVKADWEPNFIPEGFALSGTKTKDGSLYNQTWADGLHAFTIQIRPAPEGNNDDIQLETMIGPTIVVSRSTVDSRGRPQIVTVVGDLPRRTIWKIAEGVKFER